MFDHTFGHTEHAIPIGDEQKMHVQIELQASQFSIQEKFQVQQQDYIYSDVGMSKRTADTLFHTRHMSNPWADAKRNLPKTNVLFFFSLCNLP